MQTKRTLIESFKSNHGGDIYTGKLGSGPFWVIPYRNWQLVFDYHTVHTGNTNITYTRMRCVTIAMQDYRFKIGKEGLFTKISKAFGGQDIEIGDEIFDEHYRIRSNDTLMTTRLLNHFDVKSRINFTKSFTLEMTQKNSMGLKCLPGESGLIFYTVGKLKHEVEIINIIELFQHLLDQLLDLNLISEAPGLTELFKVKS